MEGFQRFIDIYLEIETPRELVKRLFLSFVKKISSPTNQITITKHSNVPATQSVPDGTKLLTVCTLLILFYFISSYFILFYLLFHFILSFISFNFILFHFICVILFTCICSFTLSNVCVPLLL